MRTGHGQAPLCTGVHTCTYTHMCTYTHTRPGLSSPVLPPAPAVPGPHYPTPLRAPELSPRDPPPAGPTAKQPGHTNCAPLSTATLVSPPPHPVPGIQNLGPESPAVLGLARLSPAQRGSAQALPAKFAGEQRCRGGTSRRRCQMQQDEGQAALGNQAQASCCH